MSQELDFPECPLTKHGVVEWCDTLDGNLRTRGDMYRGTEPESGVPEMRNSQIGREEARVGLEYMQLG